MCVCYEGNRALDCVIVCVSLRDGGGLRRTVTLDLATEG